MTITVRIVSADGIDTQTIRCATGQSLMKAALAAGVGGIEADCGGGLSCATCHVYVLDAPTDALPAPADDELGFTAAPCRAASRLSCQIALSPALDGLVVRLPDRQH